MISQRLQKLRKDKNQGITKDWFTDICYMLCKEFKWDYWVLMEQPIPFVLAMIKAMIAESKKQNKDQKRSMGSKRKR